MSLFSSLLQRASSLAAAIDQLLLSMIALGVLFVLLVLIVTFLPGKTRSEKTSAKNEGRFQLWAGLIAGAVLIALFAWSTALYAQAAKVPADATDVTVLAQRWLWKFQHYPDGKREINELHVPVDQPIKLTMISRDAIHSLAIPALGVHQDILPEQFTTIWFIANEPGEYPFYSAEYNGTGYVDMVGRVVVEEREAFDKWLGGEGELDGAALFSSLGCAACHIDAGGGIGPSMLGLYGSQATLDNGETVTADEDYLREAILDPNAAIVQNYAAVMPSFEGQLSDAQLQALIDYI
ncbi:MAG: c-type cytochrome, partial [Chloroflexi bacterium]|nr:c-type cytochrome [Chloroflexota bacterium]